MKRQNIKTAIIFISFIALGALLIPITVTADIYVYIDPDGIPHYTTSPYTDDYQLFLKEEAGSSSNREKYNSIIQEAARKNGLPTALIKAVIHAESNFKSDAVSPKGAIGLMQLMPHTITALNVSDPLDPQENIMGGTRYLRSLILRFDGFLHLALAAYNAGPKAVDKYNGIPPYRETEVYVRKIETLFRHYKNKK